MFVYMGVRKFGPFECQKQKTGAFIYFLFKNGVYHIPGGAEQGAIWHVHPYYVIYRELPPHPPGYVI